jgi:hypothetical protein
LRQKKINTKGCLISVHDDRRAGQRGELTGFRQEFYNCLIARADAWFELCDAVLCVDGPVTSLVELSLAAEHRRGHGALCDSLYRAGSTLAGSATLLPASRYHAAPAAGSCWLLMSATGCAPTRRPAPNGCSATPTAVVKVKPR